MYTLADSIESIDILAKRFKNPRFYRVVHTIHILDAEGVGRVSGRVRSKHENRKNEGRCPATGHHAGA